MFTYQMLPYGEQHPCEVGKRQENLAKNRFKTTFPCRFLLKRITLKKTYKKINNLYFHIHVHIMGLFCYLGTAENTLMP